MVSKYKESGGKCACDLEVGYICLPCDYDRLKQENQELLNSLHAAIPASLSEQSENFAKLKRRYQTEDKFHHVVKGMAKVMDECKLNALDMEQALLMARVLHDETLATRAKESSNGNV